VTKKPSQLTQPTQPNGGGGGAWGAVKSKVIIGSV
jgi:hypothetical protein